MSPVERVREAESRLYERYGLEHRERWVEWGGGSRARVVEVGDGEPVVFVIGGFEAGAFWAPMLPHLDGVKALLVERPGCGLSDPIDYRAVPDFRAHAVGFTRDLIDELGLDAPKVVCNSMGSTWVLWTALAHPDRVGASVHFGCSALLLDTGVPGPMRLFSVRGINRLLMRMEPPSRRNIGRLMTRMAEQDGEMPDELLDVIVAAHAIPSYPVTWCTAFERIARLRGTGGDPALALGEAELSRFAGPSRWIWGVHDPFGSPAVAREVARILPEAQVSVVPGGHLPWLDDPKGAALAVREFFASA